MLQLLTMGADECDVCACHRDRHVARAHRCICDCDGFLPSSELHWRVYADGCLLLWDDVDLHWVRMFVGYGVYAHQDIRGVA